MVCFTDDGHVESMTLGDNTTLEITQLDVSKCPDFIHERIALLKLMVAGPYLREGRRIIGIRVDEYRGHIYLNKPERNELKRFIKEKESAKRIPRNHKSIKRNPKPKDA